MKNSEDYIVKIHLISNESFTLSHINNCDEKPSESFIGVIILK